MKGKQYKIGISFCVCLMHERESDQTLFFPPHRVWCFQNSLHKPFFSARRSFTTKAIFWYAAKCFRDIRRLIYSNVRLASAPCKCSSERDREVGANEKGQWLLREFVAFSVVRWSRDFPTVSLPPPQTAAVIKRTVNKCGSECGTFFIILMHRHLFVFIYSSLHVSVLRCTTLVSCDS